MQFETILNQYKLSNYSVKAMDGYASTNFKISTPHKNYVLKLYDDDWLSWQQIEAENKVLLQLNNSFYPIPYKNQAGEYISRFKIEGKPKLGRLLSFLEGNFLAESNQSKILTEHFAGKLAQLDKALSTQKRLAIQAKKDIWDLQYNHLSKKHLIDVASHPIRRIAHHFFLQYQTHVSPVVDELRTQLIHGDANDWNVLVDAQNPNRLSGFIDFGDMCYSPLINEVAIALVYLMFDKEEPLQWATYFLSSYHKVLPLQEKELDILYYLIGVRLSVSLCQSAFHKKAEPEKDYISISEQQGMRLIEKWIRLNPLKAKAAFRKSVGFDTR